MHPHNAVTKHHPFAISLAIFHKALPNLKRFQSFLLESMNQSNIANVAPFSPRSFVTKAQCGSCHPCGHVTSPNKSDVWPFPSHLLYVTSPAWLLSAHHCRKSMHVATFSLCHKPNVALFSMARTCHKPNASTQALASCHTINYCFKPSRWLQKLHGSDAEFSEREGSNQNFF